MILKVANREGGIDSGQVYNAVSYASSYGVSVINLSLSGPPSEAIRDSLLQARSQLVVIAAGNTESDIGGSIIPPATIGFPARYSSSLPNVISVAAHDSSNHLACFSNYGVNVDIAAPGMDVESTIQDGTMTMNGTSQAAPVVSLTAALLVADGFLYGPRALKQRIIASADVVEPLHGVVFAEGKLNMIKTLGFREDLIELRDHSLVRGRVVPPTRLQFRNGTAPIDWGSVVKIARYSGDDAAKRFRVTTLKSGKLLHSYGDLDLSSLTTQTTTGPRECPLTDVIDFVAATGRN